MIVVPPVAPRISSNSLQVPKRHPHIRSQRPAKCQRLTRGNYLSFIRRMIYAEIVTSRKSMFHGARPFITEMGPNRYRRVLYTARCRSNMLNQPAELNFSSPPPPSPPLVRVSECARGVDWLWQCVRKNLRVSFIPCLPLNGGADDLRPLLGGCWWIHCRFGRHCLRGFHSGKVFAMISTRR